MYHRMEKTQDFHVSNTNRAIECVQHARRCLANPSPRSGLPGNIGGMACPKSANAKVCAPCEGGEASGLKVYTAEELQKVRCVFSFILLRTDFFSTL